MPGCGTYTSRLLNHTSATGPTALIRLPLAENDEYVGAPTAHGHRRTFLPTSGEQSCSCNACLRLVDGTALDSRKSVHFLWINLNTRKYSFFSSPSKAESSDVEMCQCTTSPFTSKLVTELNSKSTKRATIQFVHKQNRGYYYMSHACQKPKTDGTMKKKF